MNKEEYEQYLRLNGLKRESTPAPPKEKSENWDAEYSKNKKILDEKRTELEAKKIEAEIKRIEAETARISQGATNSVDYFQKMLEMTQKHNQEMMNMQKQIYDIQIQNIKTSDGGNFEQDLILELMPMLPQIIQQRASSTSGTGGLIFPPANAQSTQEKGGQNMKIPTAAELEEYKRKIRAGEITKEQFYEDALKSYPQLAQQATRERVYEEFEKIKASKD